MPASRKNTGRVRQTGIVPDHLSEELRKLASQLHELATTRDSEEEKLELTSRGDRLNGMAGQGERLAPAGTRRTGFTGSACSGRIPRVSLASAPIEVGEALKHQLYDRVPTVILTSATLSTAGDESGFKLSQQRLGLDESDTKQLGSPFDFQKQAELHLFRNMPDPSSMPAQFEEEVLARLPEYVAKTQGRAFVLFTSYSFLNRAAEKLESFFVRNGYTLFVQGNGLPATRLLEHLREAKKAVLFGVDSFWQGVDVQAKHFLNVSQTLPFAVPDRPLTEARLEAITEMAATIR